MFEVRKSIKQRIKISKIHDWNINTYKFNYDPLEFDKRKIFNLNRGKYNRNQLNKKIHFLAMNENRLLSNKNNKNIDNSDCKLYNRYLNKCFLYLVNKPVEKSEREKNDNKLNSDYYRSLESITEIYLLENFLYKNGFSNEDYIFRLLFNKEIKNKNIVENLLEIQLSNFAIDYKKLKMFKNQIYFFSVEKTVNNIGLITKNLNDLLFCEDEVLSNSILVKKIPNFVKTNKNELEIQKDLNSVQLTEETKEKLFLCDDDNDLNNGSEIINSELLVFNLIKLYSDKIKSTDYNKKKKELYRNIIIQISDDKKNFRVFALNEENDYNNLSIIKNLSKHKIYHTEDLKPHQYILCRLKFCDKSIGENFNYYKFKNEFEMFEYFRKNSKGWKYSKDIINKTYENNKKFKNKADFYEVYSSHKKYIKEAQRSDIAYINRKCNLQNVYLKHFYDTKLNINDYLEKYYLKQKNQRWINNVEDFENLLEHYEDIINVKKKINKNLKKRPVEKNNELLSVILNEMQFEKTNRKN